MILINKTNFENISISDSQLTTFSYLDWLIYIGAEIIPDDYPIKYRKSLDIVETEELFDKCDNIVMMDSAERIIKDADLAELERIESFKDKKVKIWGSAEKAKELTSFLTMAVSRDDIKNTSSKHYDIDSNNKKIKSNVNIYILLDMIELTDLTDFEKITGVNIDTIDDDGIRAVNQDGSYKYIVPQV